MASVIVGERERALVNEVLDSGRLAQGPVVERLEAMVAEAAGTRHGVAVTSGTTALVGALTGHGIGPGDEVIVAPFTFGATLNAVLAVGATARFADIGSDYTMDPAAFEAMIGPLTRAVIPVHLYGLCAAMPEISSIAGRHDVIVIEDAAQAIGASVAGKPAGAWGTGCFSLYATKNVMAGEGGIVTTNDDTLAARLRVLRNQGMAGRYDYVRHGLNWRLSDLHGAVGVGQMERLAEVNDARRANAASLTDGLGSIEWLSTPFEPFGRHHVFHQYTVRVHEDAPIGRDELQAILDQEGIDSGVVYPKAVYDYDCFRNHPGVITDPVPNAVRAAESVLSLPVHPRVGPDDIERIVQVIESVEWRAA